MSDNLKDDLETLEPETEVQKAYDIGRKIPWTVARQSAAMSMDSKILCGVFTSEVEDLFAKGAYPNVLRDVVIVLYLLSRSEAEVIRINARQNIDAAIAEAYLWAEKEGLKYGSAKYFEGIRTISDILGSVYNSFYIAKGKRPEAALKNDLSPLGRSESPSMPLEPAGTTPTTS